MDELNTKRKLITSLKNQEFIFCNAVNRHVTERDSDETMIRKLTINKNRLTRVFCTTDRLNKDDHKKCTDHRRLLAEERKANSKLDIVYADYSYCNFELGTMRIPEPKPKQQKPKKKKIVKKPPPPPVTKQTSDKASASSSTNNDVINILLLGESGVGKSTFINAFVNYLTSETFDRAQSNEPVVLIPVSFLITTDDHFEEHTVKFGDFVTSHNEDFDHPGESVTQHCKSYEFHLNSNDEKKLCIIDTPGFGDTRGLDQDDLNMQDILKYINNLTHLNAVCFLLKPNSSKLHIFFRMCFTQLLDLLGPNVRQNILFCFTNARSTFYMPGDTARLLKVMLKSLSIDDIPFKRENTFCFDNEAFRYLVALQNSISFDDLDRKEYEKSWEISVRESNRLIDYICQQLGVCPMDSEWKSNKHAQIAIRDMIRPMLEAMRNILRNILLYKIESPNKSIELCPKPMHRPGALCSLCALYPIRVDNFWIVREITHEFRKQCFDCSCAAEQHTLINYVLNFEVSDGPSIYQQNRIIDKVYELCHAGAEFDLFLSHTVSSSKEGPFGMGLRRMIVEEDDLCKNQKSNHLNMQLLEYLMKFKGQYEESIGRFKSNEQPTPLPNIYRLITDIRNYPTIEEQLDAIKETQKMMAEPYEISES